MRRRRTPQAGSLTSLLDVLFIIVFASLVQTTARGEERADAAERTARVAAIPEVPGPPPSLAALRDAAVTAAAKHVEGAPLVAGRIGADGTLTELEWAGERRAVGVPLLERVADADVGIAYLGDRAAALRVCGVVARELRAADLPGHVVAIAPAVALRELPVALVAGLRRDVLRCQGEQHALAVIVEPDMIGATGSGSAPGSASGSASASGGAP